MDLQIYRNQNQKVKPNASILERWEKRIVTRGLHGASGARQYLSDYGKSIGLKKVVMLARQAEMSCDIPMSEIFWAKAHMLEFGEAATGSLTADNVQAPVVQAVREEAALPGITLQPGKVVTSQPIDAPDQRSYYIAHSGYWGMQKHDGKKELAFASAFGCAWQARSMKVHPSPDQELSNAMVRVANEIGGSFVLEGEFTYLDCEGGEHRTGAQAATANINLGRPTEQPIPVYYVFDCLEYMNEDIRNYAKSERLYRASLLVNKVALYCGIIEMVSRSAY